MRTLKAALDLFAEYGVGATSYQMIADAIGVTKGAIYHQFNTKDEIIIARRRDGAGETRRRAESRRGRA